MMVTRVVLADDHSAVRAGVRRMLERESDIAVVGEASNGIEAIHQVNRLAPDILLLDMEMPFLNGVEVARELHAVGSPVCILALSAYDDAEYVLGLMACGAAGYLTKDEAAQSVIAAIHAIARGERGWLSSRAMAQVTGSRSH